MNGNLHVGLAAFGAAIAVIIGMKASDAVGRNPEASTKALVQSIPHRFRRGNRVLHPVPGEVDHRSQRREGL
jgi:F-type H+-transporting ATPase subunit c